jgi:hypothetical protein
MKIKCFKYNDNGKASLRFTSDVNGISQEQYAKMCPSEIGTHEIDDEVFFGFFNLKDIYFTVEGHLHDATVGCPIKGTNLSTKVLKNANYGRVNKSWHLFDVEMQKASLLAGNYNGTMPYVKNNLKVEII